MAQRPLILQSRLLRKLCPLHTYGPRSITTSASTSPSNSAWSVPPTNIDSADDQVARLAAQPLHHLTLSDLVRHGRPPLSTHALLSSANFTLSLLPIRLAHRIHALRNLPFIVVSNPHIARIYNNYLHSLGTLLPLAHSPITSLAAETAFTDLMADLVQTHANTIPVLARGFLECRRYIAPVDVTRFLDEHLRARIGTRLIAEQHIALHLSSQPHCGDTPAPPPTHIGVIDTRLSPVAVLRHCETFVGELCELKYGVRPSLVVNGAVDTTLAHVPTHLEYILTELLKNAFRATIESGREREPVEVTIAESPANPYPSELDTIHKGRSEVEGESFDSGAGPPTSVTIRIRDRGGGISPVHLPHIWGYSFTTFSDEDIGPDMGGGNGTIDALNTLSKSGGEGSSLAGLGYGLPLGRAYAEYFGGGVAVQSLWGWGTDVFLRLRGLGRA
ncbi:hypothetical protein MMC34_004495 [Xylographa carneopallida]|nr:hypothetical protein [Xylographa carneopallida]